MTKVRPLGVIRRVVCVKLHWGAENQFCVVGCEHKLCDEQSNMFACEKAFLVFCKLHSHGADQQRLKCDTFPDLVREMFSASKLKTLKGSFGCFHI